MFVAVASIHPEPYDMFCSSGNLDDLTSTIYRVMASGINEDNSK